MFTINKLRADHVIDFAAEDEIFDTDESVNEFVKKLDIIADTHSYMSQMETIHLEYCVSLVEEKNIPVVHFANTYNYDQRPSWVEERFAEYHLKVE